jgi:hypothetical protein
VEWPHRVGAPGTIGPAVLSIPLAFRVFVFGDGSL